MIFVDTSVWIGFFKGSNEGVVSRLSTFLDEDRIVVPAPVRLEILGGASKAEIKALARVLSALPIYYPSASTWERMEKWIESGLARGQRFGFADLMIAALTAEHGGELWSLDRDFVRMSELGWIDLVS